MPDYNDKSSNTPPKVVDASSPPSPQDATHTALPSGSNSGAIDSRPAVSVGDINTLVEISQTSTMPRLMSTGRFELREEIARGGMGVVYRATDTAFAREVAVKVLQERFGPSSRLAGRFAEEARITGQLQHPGIPPAHDLGTLPDGRPFLAMKLIKGETLDTLLDKRATPASDRGRFIAVFEQVCQAIAYAHAHSVIHRDLKPANIMVGSYGEVQVMDWGLAKVLDTELPSEPSEDDASLGTEIRSFRDGAESTQAGSLLGTPAFMPPEQAIGAVDQINERSDVFGLGAILCVILTGQPPFVSESAESSRRMAARAKLDDAFARLDACGVEPELIALAKRCLAAEPGDRPRDAEEVAEAITAHRADAERRALQAELDRARSEVRSGEERKRRRVQRVLVMTILTLFAVAGFGAWFIESVRAERETDRLTRESEQKGREADLQSRQLATERDVVAALNEAQVLREEGWKEADDPPRWALALTAARSSLRRAEALLESGEATSELRARVASAGKDFARDEKDRALLAELDRIREENEIRFLIPVMLTSRQAEMYSNAFRAYGVDLLAMPTSDVVAWLKGHRFRDLLTTAVRYWERARPITDEPGIDLALIEPVNLSAAVAGEAVVQTLLNRPSIYDRLELILKAITDDPFTKEWWDAVERRDSAKLKSLLARPEFARLSSQELSSFVEGLVRFPIVLTEFLQIAYDRFPGEFWVNFRLGSQGMLTLAFGPSEKTVAEKQREAIRYLSAAVAARPRSAMARVALGEKLLEQNKDDAMGFRMLHGAAAIDSTNPWPHLFLGKAAMETGKTAEVISEFQDAVRVEPDISFLMIYAFIEMSEFPKPDTIAKPLTQDETTRLFDGLIASNPKHAGGYVIRGITHFKYGRYRSAKEDHKKAKLLVSHDSILRAIVLAQLTTLETLAQWEEKFPAVLRGEARPTNENELIVLAEYSGGFEERYVLASQFLADAFAKDPSLNGQWMKLPLYAGWAVQAATGKGVDATDLTASERSQLRRKALSWLRESSLRINKQDWDLAPYLANSTWRNPDLAPVRDPGAIAKLPPDARAEWSRYWNELPKLGPREIAPPPRPTRP
jgi:serine/threonine protein kinase